MADQFIHHLLLLIHCGTTHVEYFSTLVSSFRWNHSVPIFKLTLNKNSQVFTFNLAFICLLTLRLEKTIKRWLSQKIIWKWILFCIFTLFRPEFCAQMLLKQDNEHNGLYVLLNPSLLYRIKFILKSSTN